MSGKQVITVTATLLIVGCFRSSAQVKSPSDSTITFGSLGQLAAIELPAKPSPNAWGVDLLVSTNGFGLGGFYRHEYNDDLSGFLDLSISEAKDDDEIDLIDYYGNTFTPGKVNRFLVMPFFIGLEQRLFKD